MSQNYKVKEMVPKIQSKKDGAGNQLFTQPIQFYFLKYILFKTVFRNDYEKIKGMSKFKKKIKNHFTVTGANSEKVI